MAPSDQIPDDSTDDAEGLGRRARNRVARHEELLAAATDIVAEDRLVDAVQLRTLR